MFRGVHLIPSQFGLEYYERCVIFVNTLHFRTKHGYMCNMPKECLNQGRVYLGGGGRRACALITRQCKF